MGIDHSNPYIHSTTVLCDIFYFYAVGCAGNVTTLIGTPPATATIDPCLVYTTSSALTTGLDTRSMSSALNNSIRDTIQPTTSQPSSVHTQTSTSLTSSSSHITSQTQPSTHISRYVQSDRTVSLSNGVQSSSTEVYMSTLKVRTSSLSRSVLLNTGKQ